MVRVLDLFSGTHSVGKVCEKLGWECVSLDLKNADININIHEWDYKKDYEPDYFDIVWSSPCCVYWSGLRRCNIGRLVDGRILTPEEIEKDINNLGKPQVDKSFEIINYFKPKAWFLENPLRGRMKEYITDKPYYDVDYCQYMTEISPKKSTRIWTNVEGFIPKRCNKKTCPHVENNKHKIQVNSRGGGSDRGAGGGREIRLAVPGALIEELFLTINFNNAKIDLK